MDFPCISMVNDDLQYKCKLGSGKKLIHSSWQHCDDIPVHDTLFSNCSIFVPLFSLLVWLFCSVWRGEITYLVMCQPIKCYKGHACCCVWPMSFIQYLIRPFLNAQLHRPERSDLNACASVHLWILWVCSLSLFAYNGASGVVVKPCWLSLHQPATHRLHPRAGGGLRLIEKPARKHARLEEALRTSGSVFDSLGLTCLCLCISKHARPGGLIFWQLC